MKAFDKNKARAILSHENRTLQSDFQNAFGNFTHGHRIERHSTLNGNINVGNCKGLTLQHLSSWTARASLTLDSAGRTVMVFMENIMFKAFVRPIAFLTHGPHPQTQCAYSRGSFHGPQRHRGPA